MKGFVKFLGVIFLIIGVGGGLFTILGIEDYSYKKLMFETSTSIADFLPIVNSILE